jgi:hypothetical protein
MLLKNTLAAGVIAVAALVGSAPANAGSGPSVTIEFGHPGYGKHYRGGDRHYRTLSPQEVRRILRAQGFREIRYVDRQGSVYQARAENRRGRDVLVTVSARSGAVIDVQRLRGRGRG